jgi:hypothetical protein
MCSVTKPLKTNLKFKYENRKISIYNGNTDIVVKSEIISKDTGSKSFVYKIICKGSNGVFPVVAKIQKSRGERLAGLEYEKIIYSLMTKIVDSGVCPFRLRSYNMFEPSNILITETFENMMDLGDFLDIFLVESSDSQPYHIDDCRNLLIQILYAIEVNYRVGIRHNDLHVHNIMIQYCKLADKKLVYLDRTKTIKRPIFMNNCSFSVKLFDNDRVTKLRAKNNNVSNTYQVGYDSKPVLNLFPWHEPKVYTEKLDLFKVMQHIRDDSRSTYLTNLVSSLNVSLSNSEKKKKSALHGHKNFLKYHLVTDPYVRKEPLAAKCSVTRGGNACTVANVQTSMQFPKWLDELNSSEKALIMIAQSQNKPAKKPLIVGDISKLYVKRKFV